MEITIEVVSQGNVDCYGETMGFIEIGSFYEYFIMATNYWTIEEYEKQWCEGLNRIKQHDTSCLIASIQNPLESMPLVNWWVLYKVGSTICVQNELFVSDVYEETFKNTAITRENCYEFIRTRATVTDSGRKVSEWCLPLE